MNVLEHVRDDVCALRNMAAVLPAGGKAVLIVPAFEALYGPIDRNLGHYRRYSKKGLRELAAAAGFEVKTLRYMNSVGCIGWWINAKLLKRTAQSETTDPDLRPVCRAASRLGREPRRASFRAVDLCGAEKQSAANERG